MGSNFFPSASEPSASAANMSHRRASVTDRAAGCHMFVWPSCGGASATDERYREGHSGALSTLGRGLGEVEPPPQRLWHHLVITCGTYGSDGGPRRPSQRPAPPRRSASRQGPASRQPRGVSRGADPRLHSLSLGERDGLKRLDGWSNGGRRLAAVRYHRGRRAPAGDRGLDRQRHRTPAPRTRWPARSAPTCRTLRRSSAS